MAVNVRDAYEELVDALDSGSFAIDEVVEVIAQVEAAIPRETARVLIQLARDKSISNSKEQ